MLHICTTQTIRTHCWKRVNKTETELHSMRTPYIADVSYGDAGDRHRRVMVWNNNIRSLAFKAALLRATPAG
jgi:hypothetical protein